MLNSHILYLMFTMCGTVEPTGSTPAAGATAPAGIPNLSAFRDVLCDLELWRQAAPELEKALIEHFFELVADTSKLDTAS